MLRLVSLCTPLHSLCGDILCVEMELCVMVENYNQLVNSLTL